MTTNGDNHDPSKPNPSRVKPPPDDFAPPTSQELANCMGRAVGALDRLEGELTAALGIVDPGTELVAFSHLYELLDEDLYTLARKIGVVLKSLPEPDRISSYPALTLAQDNVSSDFPCCYCGEYFRVGLPWNVKSAGNTGGDVCPGCADRIAPGLYDAVNTINAAYHGEY
jgi:hypothetical protein